MRHVLIPLPAQDFDPTEAGLSWRILRQAGHAISFATPKGERAEADPRMITGKGLAIWKPLLRAGAEGRAAYAEMTADGAFAKPLTYSALADREFDGLLLPGGHAPGMKSYLEARELQAFVARHFDAGKPVGAVCHGVVLAARSISSQTGRSVLHGRKTTALLQSQELAAWWLTRAWLGAYYRTYPETVEAEVKRVLRDPGDFRAGPPTFLGGFVVRDGNYVSARWPGDVRKFATAFLELL